MQTTANVSTARDPDLTNVWTRVPKAAMSVTPVG
jgi:hypothetical protein